MEIERKYPTASEMHEWFHRGKTDPEYKEKFVHAARNWIYRKLLSQTANHAYSDEISVEKALTIFKKYDKLDIERPESVVSYIDNLVSNNLADKSRAEKRPKNRRLASLENLSQKDIRSSAIRDYVDFIGRENAKAMINQVRNQEHR